MEETVTSELESLATEVLQEAQVNIFCLFELLTFANRSTSLRSHLKYEKRMLEQMAKREGAMRG